MHGVVFTGDRTLEMQTFADPAPGPGEVVLEVKASGMCGSDLHFYRAPPGEAARRLGLGDTGAIIAGHEPCGVVVARGEGVSDAEARMGGRYMDHHYAGCGICEQCRVGWSQLCPEGFVVYGVTAHGAHAQYITVPARTLVPLPDDMSFAAGAAVACGTGTAYGALVRMDLSGRDTIAIFGQGPVGLSATMLSVAMGARVIALDIGSERRALALEHGAATVLDPNDGDAPQALRDLTHGRGVDLALDTSGNPQARAEAVRATRVWGKVCFVGEGGTVTLDVSQELIRKQLTVIGSWTFSSVGQSDCARFCVDRDVPVDSLFTHHWKLAQAAEAYTLFDTQTTGKGVFLAD